MGQVLARPNSIISFLLTRNELRWYCTSMATGKFSKNSSPFTQVHIIPVLIILTIIAIGIVFFSNQTNKSSADSRSYAMEEREQTASTPTWTIVQGKIEKLSKCKINTVTNIRLCYSIRDNMTNGGFYISAATNAIEKQFNKNVGKQSEITGVWVPRGEPSHYIVAGFTTTFTITPSPTMVPLPSGAPTIGP